MTRTARSTRRRTGFSVLALFLALAMVAVACGGDDDDSDTGSPTTLGVKGPEDEGTPEPGGSITYALEAETTGGYCLAEAQLAISGIQVARALYDTLTAPNADGEITPYLAESYESNADATEWTIKLRDGVTFHDGTKLDATVVKNNLDAYRGQYPARQPLLFVFVMSDVDTVEVVDPLTVKVTTKRSWPAFPWFLWSSGRFGIMGQKQLDSTKCNNDLIGTGPFQLKSRDIGGDTVVEKNPNYWQKDAEGNQLPYLDQITFVGVESGPDRTKALQAGDYDVIHTSGALEIEKIREETEAGDLASVESDLYGEVSYNLLNGADEPFNNVHARKAVTLGVNREAVNTARAHDIPTLAQGPFAPGNVGYLDDAGFPEFDADAAKAEVEAYKEDTGKDLQFTYTHAADPDTTKTAELQQQMWRQLGIDVSLNPVGDQSQLINIAIGNDFQMVSWRNHPGADPDTQYVWWHCDAEEPDKPGSCDNPVNFGNWNDPEINKLLEDGRVSLDEAERTGIYEDLNREFAKKLWNIWGSYTIWDIASQTNVHGVLGPPLPDGSEPFKGLATGHPVLGMWVSK